MTQSAIAQQDAPFVVVNTFTPRLGAVEQFLAVQKAALPELTAHAEGWRGTRLYRAAGGTKVWMVSVFATPEDFERFEASATFAAHRERVRPLLESAEPARCDPVYAAGAV